MLRPLPPARTRLAPACFRGRARLGPTATPLVRVCFLVAFARLSWAHRLCRRPAGVALGPSSSFEFVRDRGANAFAVDSLTEAFRSMRASCLLSQNLKQKVIVQCVATEPNTGFIALSLSEQTKNHKNMVLSLS